MKWMLKVRRIGAEEYGTNVVLLECREDELQGDRAVFGSAKRKEQKMNIHEAVQAAKAMDPVVYMDPLLGAMPFARICEINKVFRKQTDIAQGKEPEQYYLTLESMRSRVGSLHTCRPEDVRLATAQDIINSGIHREDVVLDAIDGYDRIMSRQKAEVAEAAAETIV